MATAMANVALFEHCTISSSSWIIFFIRDTKSVNNSHVVGWVRTGKRGMAGDLVGGLFGGFFRGHGRENCERNVVKSTAGCKERVNKIYGCGWQMGLC